MKKICALLITLMLLSLPLTALAVNDVEQVTRAEFIKDILTLANIEIVETTESSFGDVTDSQYMSYIETAYNLGIVSGYGEVFHPGQSITKEQAVSIIVNIFGEKAGLKEVTENDINSNLNFIDGANISNWAKPIITYALKSGLLNEKDILYPKQPLTLEESTSLLETAKSVYVEKFTKNGLSASQMLIASNNTVSDSDTYKQKGTMNMNMKMMVEGVPQEVMDADEELKGLVDQGIDMSMEIEVQAQNPDKAYIKEIIKPKGLEPSIDEQIIEIYMDGTSMYTKMMGSEKWSVQDISSLLNQIQSVTPSNEPYKMAQLSEQDLQLFKDYARFDEDAVIDGKEYYVIDMFIDKESYKEYFMEIIENTMDSVVQLQSENPEIKNDPTFDPDLYKEMMMQMIGGMEVEMNYKYYVDKSTMNYEKMWISQDVYMPMDNLITAIAEMAGDEGIPDMSVKMLSHMEGEFELYDFNKEVSFPVITPEDILDLNQPQF